MATLGFLCSFIAQISGIMLQPPPAERRGAALSLPWISLEEEERHGRTA